jgi:hypothetical protein
MAPRVSFIVFVFAGGPRPLGCGEWRDMYNEKSLKRCPWARSTRRLDALFVDRPRSATGQYQAPGDETNGGSCDCVMPSDSCREIVSALLAIASPRTRRRPPRKLFNLPADKTVDCSLRLLGTNRPSVRPSVRPLLRVLRDVVAPTAVYRLARSQSLFWS